MKAFINLLIETKDYEDVERLEDAVLHLCEEEGLKVIWSKSKEAEDKP